MWIILFLKKRKEIDYKRFNQASAEHSNLIQLINGMQEIKLNNCEKQKRWEWENIQAKLFKVSIKGLALSQYQQSGAFFINETKNILVYNKDTLCAGLGLDTSACVDIPLTVCSFIHFGSPYIAPNAVPFAVKGVNYL